MSRRSLPFVLSLLVLGCGGRYRPSTQSGLTFGDSSADLVISGGATRSATLVGTGAAHGNVVIVEAKPDQSPFLDVDVDLASDAPGGAVLAQILVLRLNEGTVTETGKTFDLADPRNFAAYFEYVDGVADPDWRAAGGMVTVVSREGSRIALRLTEVALSQGGARPILISGTLSGTVTTESPVGP